MGWRGAHAGGRRAERGRWGKIHLAGSFMLAGACFANHVGGGGGCAAVIPPQHSISAVFCVVLF